METVIIGSRVAVSGVPSPSVRGIRNVVVSDRCLFPVFSFGNYVVDDRCLLPGYLRE